MADVVANLEEFEPYDDLPEHFFIIMYGLRRSGKTTLNRTMLFNMKDRGRLENHKVYLFSKTAQVSPEDYRYIPKKAKYHMLNEIEHDLGKIIGEQKSCIIEYNEAMEKDPDDESKEEPKPILVILDDCVSEETIRHSPSLNELAVAGRHIYISVIILSQVVTGSGSVPPTVRTQADAIVVVAQPRSEIERDLLAKQYLAPDKSYNNKTRGLEVLGAVTNIQYRALVILTTDSSARKFEDYLLTYGPVNDDLVPEDFRLGTEEQWEDEDEPKSKKRKYEKATKPSKTPTHLPNPFTHAPNLPMLGDTFLHGLSDSSSVKRRRK